eukprot:SM000167S02962  [mRNA]  locus=s167:180058:181078:- [translate_table: standard]
MGGIVLIYSRKVSILYDDATEFLGGGGGGGGGAEKENLCLYGYSDETWEVNLPAEEVPPELPEPALGINFARDGMQRKDWLSLVAVHSDAWLLAVAFYYGARFDKAER